MAGSSTAASTTEWQSVCVCAWGGLQPKPRPRKRRAPSLGGRVPCERLAAAARPRARCSSLSFYFCCIGDADARVGMCRSRTSAAARASGWWTRCMRPVGQKSPQQDWQSRPARPVGCPGAGGLEHTRTCAEHSHTFPDLRSRRAPALTCASSPANGFWMRIILETAHYFPVSIATRPH